MADDDADDLLLQVELRDYFTSPLTSFPPWLWYVTSHLGQLSLAIPASVSAVITGTAYCWPQ